MWPNYRSAGAQCLIVSGILETSDAARMFTEALPDTALTICRLQAKPETLHERIFLRGRGGGPQLPGDQELNGASTERLMEILTESVEAAEMLERNGIGNLLVDTDGRSIKEVAQLILAKAEGWPELLKSH
jgi:hypothetical protein